MKTLKHSAATLLFALTFVLLLESCSKDNNPVAPGSDNSGNKLTTVSVSKIDETTATTGGMFEGSSEVLSKGVCYSTNSNPTLIDNFTNEGSGPGLYSSQLTDLSQNTTYYVRAYAVLANDTIYGNEIKFSTLKRKESTITLNGDVFTTNTTLTCSAGGSFYDSDKDSYMVVLQAKTVKNGNSYMVTFIQYLGNKSKVGTYTNYYSNGIFAGVIIEDKYGNEVIYATVGDVGKMVTTKFDKLGKVEGSFNADMMNDAYEYLTVSGSFSVAYDQSSGGIPNLDYKNNSRSLFNKLMDNLSHK